MTSVVRGNIPRAVSFCFRKNYSTYSCPCLWGKHKLDKNFNEVMMGLHRHTLGPQSGCAHLTMLSSSLKPKIKHPMSCQRQNVLC